VHIHFDAPFVLLLFSIFWAFPFFLFPSSPFPFILVLPFHSKFIAVVRAETKLVICIIFQTRPGIEFASFLFSSPCTNVLLICLIVCDFPFSCSSFSLLREISVREMSFPRSPHLLYHEDSVNVLNEDLSRSIRTNKEEMSYGGTERTANCNFYEYHYLVMVMMMMKIVLPLPSLRVMLLHEARVHGVSLQQKF
jgi:hypothetical protein